MPTYMLAQSVYLHTCASAVAPMVCLCSSTPLRTRCVYAYSTTIAITSLRPFISAQTDAYIGRGRKIVRHIDIDTLSTGMHATRSTTACSHTFAEFSLHVYIYDSVRTQNACAPLSMHERVQLYTCMFLHTCIRTCMCTSCLSLCCYSVLHHTTCFSTTSVSFMGGLS